MWHGFNCQTVIEHGKYAGFGVSFYGRHLTVKASEYGTLEIVSTGSHVAREMNPYAYYKLFNYILEDLSEKFEPKESMLSKAPRKVQLKWFKKKVCKYWCRCIHSEWQKLLRTMEPKRLDLSRAMFAANFSNAANTGLSFLRNYESMYNGAIQEILDFTAAAMLADAHPTYFKKPPEDAVMFLPYRANEDLMGSERIDKITFYMDSDAFNEQMMENADNEDDKDGKVHTDWRSFFAPYEGKTVSKELSQTLASVKPGYSFSTLQDLSTVELERPLLSKQELVVTITAVNKKKEPSFRVSDKQSIIEAMHILDAESIIGNEKIGCRKTGDLMDAVNKVQHAPGFKGTQDMLKLTKRVVDDCNGKWTPPVVDDDDDATIFDSLGF